MKDLTKRDIERVGKQLAALTAKLTEWEKRPATQGAQRHRYLYARKLVEQGLEQLRELYREV